MAPAPAPAPTVVTMYYACIIYSMCVVLYSVAGAKSLLAPALSLQLVI